MAEDVETVIPQDIDPHRYAEMAWIGEHANEYKGLWVALQGNALLSHGPDLHVVSAEAKKKFHRPLYFHVPEHWGEPSLGFF